MFHGSKCNLPSKIVCEFETKFLKILEMYSWFEKKKLKVTILAILSLNT
jgi:hypothetical protein